MKLRSLHVLAFVMGLTAIGLAAGFVLPALAIEHHPKTLADLQAHATLAATTPSQRKIRVLIVPGHEPNADGTTYRGVKERDLNVQLGQDLQKFLDADGRYETILARDTHAWNPAIDAYVTAHWDEIDAWRKDARAEMDARIASGEVSKPVVHVGHNNAPDAVAVRLYGITKWANENDIDVIVHVHFDDDRAYWWQAGRRTGFAVFVPTPQYDNAVPTRAIADKVLARLSAFNPPGNLTGEASGIVEDPGLIAVGEHNTSDVPSMLIEYAFIYEKQLRTPAIRALALNDLAYQTFLGVGDFFFGNPADTRPTATLPYAWKNSIRYGAVSADVYALQTALMRDGEFPAPHYTKNSCTRNGSFGPCTRAALNLFQKKYAITGESGFAGRKTFAKLEALSTISR